MNAPGRAAVQARTGVRYAAHTLSSPFDGGYEAALLGRPFESNPYSGWCAVQWEDGYVQGLRESGRKDFSVKQL